MAKWKKRHGKRHWGAVVLIRLVKFVIALVLGAYFFSFGFSLSKTTLLTFFAKEQLDLVDQYYVYVPSFIWLKSKTVDLLSLGSGGLATWWTMVVGIPLMLMGVTSLLSNFFSFLFAIFDYVYSLGHCPWYEWHKLTVDVLKNGRNHSYKKRKN